MGRKNKNEGVSSNRNDFESIKIECAESFKALGQGKHAQALKMMKKLCSKHGNSPHSAYVYYARLTVLLEVTKVTNDPNAKTRLYSDAKEAAEIAVRLSSSSISLSHLYACVKYEMANDKKEYEEVVEECKRGLAVKDPVDPAEEGILENYQYRILSAQDRIEFFQYKLRNLIQMSNIASIATWMHHSLGKGEYKFRLVLITRDSNVPMVQRVTPDEIEKTGEGMEVRLADDRIMQNRLESLHLRNDVESTNNNRGLERSSPGSTQRLGERRKSGNARENTYSCERMDFVRSYWNSKSSGWKKKILRIKILDLKKHFRKSENGSLSEVLDEALSFCQANKAWKFWMCCLCNNRYMDFDSLMDHVKFVHLARFVSAAKSSPPLVVENEWVQMLLNCLWKPVELNDALRILEEKSKPEALDFFGPCIKKNLLQEHWPLSDDPERATLLEKIHAVFHALIKHKYLTSRHLSKVIQYAVAALGGLECGPMLINSKMDQTPLCICLLGARDLDKILKYLEEISHACGISRYPDESNVTDVSEAGVQRVDIIERVGFNQDCSFLVLDEHLLHCKIPRYSCNGAVSGVSTSATSSHISDDNDVVLDSDAILSWIFISPSTSEQLATWRRVREEKTKQGLETLLLLEKNLDRLNDFFDKKYENLSDEEALRTVEDLCFQNRKKRDDASNSVRQSYETVLQDRLEKLTETEERIDSNREFVAIEKVLYHAKKKSQLCVPESDEIDDCRTSDYLQQVDSCIEVAIHRQKEQVSIELGKIDAMIMVIAPDVKQLTDKFEAASSHDYESIIIPLVKSFLRAYLKDLAKKDLKVTSSDHESHAQIRTDKEILLPRVCNEDDPASRISVPATDDNAALLQDEENMRFVEQSLKLRK